jgi:hypothetical protein
MAIAMVRVAGPSKQDCRQRQASTSACCPRTASVQFVRHSLLSLRRAVLLGFLLLIHSIGCGPQDRTRVWNEIRQGASVPLDRIEQSQAQPVETKAMGGDFERRIYRRKGESDVLVVVVDLASGRAVRESIVTPNILGKVPYEIWTVCAAIREGSKMSVADVEQSFGAPVDVESVDPRTERRTYRENGDKRLLVVTVDATSRLSTNAMIVTPYSVCGTSPFDDIPRTRDSERRERNGGRP